MKVLHILSETIFAGLKIQLLKIIKAGNNYNAEHILVCPNTPEIVKFCRKNHYKFIIIKKYHNLSII